MYTNQFFLSLFLCSVVLRHAGTVSLVDLVKQSAAKLKPRFFQGIDRQGPDGQSSFKVLSNQGLTQTNPASVLPENVTSVKEKQGEITDASIQQAVDLVLQYIQLTPDFKSLHGIDHIEGVGTGQQTEILTDQKPLKTTDQNFTFAVPQESTTAITKEKMSPEQQLALLLSVADEIKKIGTPSSIISLQEAVRLLKQLAPNAALPQTFPSMPLEEIQQIMQPELANTDSICRGSCPPKWINILDFFSHLLAPGSEMCHIYQTMDLNSCDTPNTSCKPGYTCCSRTCMDKIVVCDPWYPHKVPDHICVPEDVNSWWPEVHRKLPQIIDHGTRQRQDSATTEKTILT